MLNSIKIAHKLRKIRTQFQGLDNCPPALWPSAPRYTVLFMVFSLVLFTGYTLIFSAQWDELSGLIVKEEEQKKEFINKLTKAKNIE